jgi:parallel beta-helix repeat protein
VLALVLWSGCATGQTGSAFNISGTKARISGSVISNEGGDVEYWVQYGPTTSYGSESEHATASGTTANNPHEIFVALPGLERSTTYNFRVCAQDGSQQGGPGCGENHTFTTPNLGCGDTITHDFTLSGDVFCESFVGTGLIVGAAGVEIDLDGHSLRGPIGSPESSTPTGIDNTGGFDDLTVRDGTVTAWGVGFDLHGDRNRVLDVGAFGNTAGIKTGGAGSVIRRTSMTGSRFGSGLLVDTSSDFIVADSTGNKWVIRGDDARIVRNVLSSAGQFNTCLGIAGNRNRLAYNHVDGCDGGSIVLAAGSDNVLVGNEAFGSTGPPEGTILDGIFVGAFTAGTVLRGNYAHDNDDDGFDIRGVDTRLEDNRADDNGDFGIDAVAGVTDLGGNTATGNGNPLQCRNVACP